jgi:adenine deaminase
MIRLRRVALTLVVFSATTTLDACSREPEFALVIRGGSVMDGAGGEAQPADIGIKGDRIVAIGNLSGRSASARSHRRLRLLIGARPLTGR